METYNMLTTKEVRKIMRKYGRDELYTNQVKDPNQRRVKCYAPQDMTTYRALIEELFQKAGEENVTETDGCGLGFGIPGITVLCQKA